MKFAIVAVTLLGLTHARVAKRANNVIGGVCFEPLDCLITGYGFSLTACSREGDNASLFGLLGYVDCFAAFVKSQAEFRRRTCVDGKAVKASTSSSGGFLSALGLGKREE